MNLFSDNLASATDAAGQWCPFTRVYELWQSRESETLIAINRYATNDHLPPGSGCIGPRCMAWRWADGTSMDRKFQICWSNRNATKELPRPAAVPASWEWVPHDPDENDPAGWREDEASALARRRGFCGLSPLGVPA